jgi:hypothetical protein
MKFDHTYWGGSLLEFTKQMLGWLDQAVLVPPDPTMCQLQCFPLSSITTKLFLALGGLS